MHQLVWIFHKKSSCMDKVFVYTFQQNARKDERQKIVQKIIIFD